jgi:hypothetical protein
MCRGAFASGRIARVGCAILERQVSPATRLDDALHRGSAKTGRGAFRRRADHQEENLRAARPIRALPPLFASVLHERDLRSFQRAASMHLFVACALTVPGGSSDRRVCVHQNCPPKWFIAGYLALCYQGAPKKDALRSRLRPGLARLVSIPNSPFCAAAGYDQYRFVFDVHFQPG